MEKAQKKAVIERSPLVSFWYPMSKEPLNTKLRQVRLIAATNTHLVGLEMTKGKKNRINYRYKKFCQFKVRDFKVQEFNPKALA